MNRGVAMRVVGLAICAALLCACGSAPPVPDWRLDAQSALDDYERHRLAGSLAVAERDFARALSAVSATGRPDLLVRVRLVRCAMAVASVAFAECPDPVALAGEGGADEQAYAAYLGGARDGFDAKRLPSGHGAVAQARSDADRLAAVRAIEPPASRLVALGVLFRRAELPPEGVELAVDTASDAGLRGALLAWLGIQEKVATAAGDTARAAAIRRRIAVAGGA